MNFIRADFKKTSRPSPVLWGACTVCVALALVGAAWTWREWREVDLQHQRLREAIAQKDTPPPTPLAGPTKSYEASARELLAERTIPWPQALTTLEATAIVGVTPVSVEFGNGDKAIRLEVTFTDYGSLLEYLNALNAGEPDLRWKLAQSQSQGTASTSSMAVLIGTMGGR